MEYYSKCPLCSSKKIKKYCKQVLVKRSIPKNISDVENQFLLNRLRRESLIRYLYLCRSCYLLFQNPTYDSNELQRLYSDRGPKVDDHYKDVKKTEKKSWALLIKRNSMHREKRYANAILTHGGRKILDYGGCIGTNLLHPSLNTKKRYVYDFGKDSIPEEGIISLKNLDDSHRFDFILHTHVLEHETNPLSSLKKLRQITNPKGFLYLEVPFEYTERILTRRPGAIWHVNYFNRKSIMEVANRTGWKCQSFKIAYLPYSYFYINCIIAVMKPFSNRSKPNKPVNNMQVLYDMSRSLLKRLISEPFANYLNRENFNRNQIS